MSRSLAFALALTFGASVAAAEEAGKPAKPSEAPQAYFEERGAAAGLRFVHSTRDFGKRYKAEVLEMFTDGGAAAAVGDFDGDGWEDLYVLDSDTGKPNHLMRNNGDLTFTNVAKEAGVTAGNDEKSICADALFMDYDNDGDQDLFIGRFGTSILYRNDGPDASGQVRFTDVSEVTGLSKIFGNTIAVVAFDAEGDGDLDVLLGDYFPPEDLLNLESRNVLPNNLDYADNGGGVVFLENRPGKDGERLFVDVTETSGMAHHSGWTLDVGHADLDNDGDQDVYLAGDYGTDRLFLNRGNFRFEDVTESAMGFDTKKGMNVDMGDYNRDGWLDIYVTNITDEYMQECNMLWHNNGDGTWIDLSKETGSCDSDWGWAAKFADFDNDGWEDLFVVNGLRSRNEENYIPVLLEAIILPGVDFSSLDSYPDIGERTWSGYQKQRLFMNLGGSYKEAAAEARVDNDLDGRGIAVADFDHDGGLDFYQTNANQPALFYVSKTRNPGSWVGLELEGTRSNRDAIGARVWVTAGGETYMREVYGGNGYSSQSSKRLHFGLGRATSIEKVEIRWPSGRREVLEASGEGPALAIGALHHLREGDSPTP